MHKLYSVLYQTNHSKLKQYLEYTFKMHKMRLLFSPKERKLSLCVSIRQALAYAGMCGGVRC